MDLDDDDLEDLNPRQVPLRALRPASWNPRVIKSQEFKNLMRSMQEDPRFLRLRPILAQGDGTIYAGDKRYMAAQQLGYETVWAVIADVPPVLAYQRNIRDNLHWGSFDEAALGPLLDEIEQLGGNVDTLGFDDKQLASLRVPDLPEPGDQKVDETPRLWGVVVTCVSEQEQTELLERLQQEGRQVRALIA